MATSAIKRKIIKKRTKPFRRFQKATTNKSKGNCFISMRTGWRKPKGIDNRVRRKFGGTCLMPKVGYGSNKKTRHMMPNGLYKATVTCPGDLDMYLMHNDKFAVEFAHNLSSKTRKAMVEKAEKYGLYITNKWAKLETEEA